MLSASLLRPKKRRCRARQAQSRRQRAARRRPSRFFEPLEDRTLLSVAPAWVIDAGGIDIALDGLGNIYVPGAKFTSAGESVWAQTIGGRARSIAVDSAGNSYVTGFFSSSADFGSTQLTASGGTADAFVTKIDTNGNFLWTSQISGSNGADAWNIAVDETSLYVIGVVKGNGQFGNETTSSPATDGYVTKLDTTNGDFLWTQILDGSSGVVARGVALDGSGDLYVSGSFSKRMNLDGIRLRSAGDGDIFLTKMTSQGDFVWGKSAGGPDGDQADAVAVDTDGNLYLKAPSMGLPILED